MEYRRAGTMVLYWHEGELTAENYLSPKAEDQENAVGIDSLAVEILDRFDNWTDEKQIAEAFADYAPESVAEAVRQLAECSLLSTRESAADEDRLLRVWQHWGEEARFFHFATKNVEYRVGQDDEENMHIRRETREIAGGPPPAIFKTYPDAPRIYLSRTFLPLAEELGSVLRRRRTHRQFTGAQVDEVTLSTLLFYTFAPMLFCDADVFGTLPMKTSPSGGARHELEGYVVALEVNGVQPGLYHYNAEGHALELLSTDVDRATLERLTYGIPMPPASAFVCIVTAVFPRTMYKYHHPRNYRVTLLGAGHLGQTFALGATALGLGAWQTVMFRDDELERVLGLDGYAEGALYLLGAGYPVTTKEGLPPDLRHASATMPSGLIEEHRSPQ
jgi:SagB-type dehydrogenase family enzyme